MTNTYHKYFSTHAGVTELRIPKGVKVAELIQIVVDKTDCRLQIFVEEDAEVAVLLCDHATGEANGDMVVAGATEPQRITDIGVHSNAILRLCTLEETTASTHKVTRTRIEQAAGSVVEVYALSLHGGCTHNYTEVKLNEPNAITRHFGAIIADGTQQIVDHLQIVHQASNCRSEVRYKYILDDQAAGNFTGVVVVHPEAQQTASQVTNANICLSPAARMQTAPILEIYADDVKCAHGATVGQLDDNARFYLMQRGVSESEANRLLLVAFIDDVVSRIELQDLRDHLTLLIQKRFKGERVKCNYCNQASQ